MVADRPLEQRAAQNLAQTRTEEALVPQRPEMADRMRGTHQHRQTATQLSRCRYKGDSGMKRWVGLCAIADNVINVGHAMEKQSHT
jgi:hypothetical protein